ncbi:RBBP9/YdeN family alpha/beta hydrolase [Thiolinea disciformis]|uniref:RBBP9/YdeN family alpha/beta hydrolase n=1 Tax=Thiolinea disciformis TaxID=125614 RepID=UPI0003775137|nr:alpha/beta hydrolase [Thiolinea disciformis]
MENILIVPGLYGSGLQHWQSWFEHKVRNCVRVEQPDWDNPILSEWVNTFNRYMEQVQGRIWIVAHSFGCLTTMAAAQQYTNRIAGAMLVAPANPERFNSDGFQESIFYISAQRSLTLKLPQHYPQFPTLVIASTNDPWMPLEQAKKWAERWESGFINAGAVGHINIASGHGPWLEGLEYFQRFKAAQQYIVRGDIVF